MSNKKNTTPIAEMDAQQLAALVAEKDAIIADQEKTISDLMDKLSSSETRRVTGKVLLTHNKTKYEVVAPKVPTLDFAKEIGATSIPAEELHKHPKLVERFLDKGIGFIQPVGE